MKKQLLTLFILLFPLLCKSQVDTTYIKPYNQKISIQAYMAKTFLILTHQMESVEKTYQPNNPPTIGVGIAISNTIIDVSYGYGFDFMRNKEQGKTKSFDFQLHHYNRKFLIDLFIQNYKGFYMDDPELVLCPDLKVESYGLHGEYIFNHKKFSYKAAFYQNERQLKSAGTFLAGAGVYLTKIQSDSSFIYNENNSVNNFQFSIGGGYAYTKTLGRRWFVSGAISVGISFGCDKISNFGKTKLEVYPTALPRLAVGYNRESWSIGMYFVGNFVTPSMTGKNNIAMVSGDAKLAYIRRFNLGKKNR